MMNRRNFFATATSCLLLKKMPGLKPKRSVTTMPCVWVNGVDYSFWVAPLIPRRVRDGWEIVRQTDGRVYMRFGDIPC